MTDPTLAQLLDELFRLRIVVSQLSEQVKWLTQERDELKQGSTGAPK